MPGKLFYQTVGMGLWIVIIGSIAALLSAQALTAVDEVVAKLRSLDGLQIHSLHR